MTGQLAYVMARFTNENVVDKNLFEITPDDIDSTRIERPSVAVRQSSNDSDHMNHLTSPYIDQCIALWPSLNGVAFDELPGEFDLNFSVAVDGVLTHVLKIMRVGLEPAEVAGQVAAIDACVDAGLPASAVVRTSAGDAWAEISASDGQTRIAWLVEAVPGLMLADIPDVSTELLDDLGVFVAALHSALADLDRPTLDIPMLALPIKWNMQQADWVAEQLHTIDDGQRRARVADIVDRHLSVVQPQLIALPQRPLHYDLNPNNLFVDITTVGHSTISGLVDFGDMRRGARVIEIGILAAYLLPSAERPMDRLCELTAAVHKHEPFSSAELVLLFPVLEMRLASSVVNSAMMSIERPDDPYVIISEAASWSLLDALKLVDPGQALARLRTACDLPATEHHHEITSYLDKARGSFAEILPTLPVATANLLDISVSRSTTQQNPFELTEHEAELMANSDPGDRGGWGEPRLIYAADAFRDRPGLGGRRRSLHIGVDVMGPAGTPVHAPLDGSVVVSEERPDRLDYGSVVILEHATPTGESFWSLYGHLSYPSIAHLEPGQRVNAGQQIATLGRADENGGWAPHLHLQLATMTSGFGSDWPGACDPDQWKTWQQIFPNPAALLNLEDVDVAYEPTSTAALLMSRQRLPSNMSISYDEPVQMVRGWKHHLIDEMGRTYLDAYNNVPHVGHAHPRITAVTTAQAHRINTNSRYLHSARAAFTEAITSRLPDGLDVCFLVSSGSEANDVALRLAQAWQPGGDTIVQQWGYHGITAASVGVSHYKFGRLGGLGTPDGVHVLDVPDTYRGRHSADDPDAGSKYAADVDGAIAAATASGRPITSFLAESFPSVGGQLVPPPGYLAAVYERVRAAGGLCIADEVQTGLGRLGAHYWGFEHQAVVPDVVVLGKPLGNGYPLAAVVTSADIAGRFANEMEFFSTFGGSTLACVIGSEVLSIIDDEDLQRNAQTVGNTLLLELRRLGETYDLIGDVRGLGLFIGVELVTDPDLKTPATAAARWIKNELRRERILIGTDGPHDNVLKIRPPMTFDYEAVEWLIDRLDRALAVANLAEA